VAKKPKGRDKMTGLEYKAARGFSERGVSVLQHILDKSMTESEKVDRLRLFIESIFYDVVIWQKEQSEKAASRGVRIEEKSDVLEYKTLPSGFKVVGIKYEIVPNQDGFSILIKDRFLK
jgi:hypothetical protein